MSNIIDALPFLEGWKYEIEEHEPPKSPKVIKQNGMLEILKEETDVSGWFLYGAMMVDNPYTTLYVDADYWSIDVTPAGLYNYGAITRVKFSAWCSKYDDSAKEYAIRFPMVWLPFRERRHVYLFNSGTEVCHLKSYTIAIVKITDREKLLRSYRELFLPTFEGGMH